MIIRHNADLSQTYKMGINQFADITHDEFSQKILNPNLKNMKKSMSFDIL
jgi:hypothetical protein